ncbi:glycosyltransferase family 61 protein [Methylobacterium oxalidis]|uniref:glycosyltransferase family 61 protein n=1 Tax=Methylobacterium oxalidis TaxID=944322 RepID=UPI003315E8FB
MSDLWIAPYHRDAIPEGIDNSTFGESVSLVSPFEADEALGCSRSKYAESRLLPASRIFPSDSDIRNNVYAACEASVERAICGPLPTNVFFPDSAALVESDSTHKFLTESLWHSEIFFSKFARCDRTTDWKYRIDKSFSPINIKGMVANAYHRYSYQYFHWFFESMPRVWALQKELQTKKLIWFAGPLDQKFHRQSLEILDLDLDHFLRIDGSAAVRFEAAYNVSFRFTENINTLRPDFNSGRYNVGWSDDYVFDLRDRASEKVKSLSGLINGEKLYIARPDTTHRKVINEREVISLLERYGFEVFVPGTKSLYEQIAAFKKARVIVGPHGAGFTNIMWSNPGAVVLEFMPAALLDVGYRFLSNFAGHSHNVILCKELPHPQGNAYANIEVDLMVLQRALKEILA